MLRQPHILRRAKAGLLMLALLALVLVALGATAIPLRRTARHWVTPGSGRWITVSVFSGEARPRPVRLRTRYQC
jgi:hypothetical protein